MLLAVDTETTGTDFYHGAKPFLVTTCDDTGKQLFWEWEVNPTNREPIIPVEDKKEITDLLYSADELIFQNVKFDVKAFESIGIEFADSLWDRVHDDLIASHLLASNQPHDLTSTALTYLKKDIEPHEKKMEIAVKEARRYCRSHLKHWMIAKEGLIGPDGAHLMPSYKPGQDKNKEDPKWKYDTWLLKALRKHNHFKHKPEWDRITSTYANVDSSATLAIWQRMAMRIKKLDLWEVYLESAKLPSIIHGIERRGVFICNERCETLTQEYKAERKDAKTMCEYIADQRNFDFILEGKGSKKSLHTFVFDVLKLPVAAWTKKGNPSIDSKVAIPHYLATLEGDELKFIQEYASTKDLGTKLNSLASYRRYRKPSQWLDFYLLHSTLNPTGTDTLRFSSKNPNSQNHSKKKDWRGRSLRYCLGPRPGREWWSLDFENIELRIPAYIAGEQAMIDLFEYPNEPPFYGSNHLLFFSILHPKLWADGLPFQTKDRDYIKDLYKDTWYQWTKNGDFAVQYGAMAESGTADRAYHVPGAQRIIESRLTNIKKLSDEKIAFANRYGYVETVPDRTIKAKRGYPLWCTRTERGNVKPTVPLSYFVQGTAMWCTRRAMVRCEDQLRRWTARDPQGYFMVLQVHDELVFDFPAGGIRNLPRVRKLVQLMEQSGDDIGVPLKVSYSWHPHNWADKGSLKAAA